MAAERMSLLQSSRQPFCCPSTWGASVVELAGAGGLEQLSRGRQTCGIHKGSLSVVLVTGTCVTGLC